jgi:hypothetical protein
MPPKPKQQNQKIAAFGSSYTNPSATEMQGEWRILERLL